MKYGFVVIGQTVENEEGLFCRTFHQDGTFTETFQPNEYYTPRLKEIVINIQNTFTS